MALPPASLISFATSSAVVMFKSATATVKPSLDNRLTIALPIPCAPPVTNATYRSIQPYKTPPI